MKGILARLLLCVGTLLAPLLALAQAEPTAVPEPAMMFLLGLALIGLVIVQHYKNKGAGDKPPQQRNSIKAEVK